MRKVRTLGVVLITLALASGCSNPDPDGANSRRSKVDAAPRNNVSMKEYVPVTDASPSDITWSVPETSTTTTPVDTTVTETTLPSTTAPPAPSTTVTSSTTTPPKPKPPVTTPPPPPPPAVQVNPIPIPAGITIDDAATQELITLIKRARGETSVDPNLSMKARNWAVSMASSGRAVTHSNLADGLPAGWKTAGDLVAKLPAGSGPHASGIFSVWQGNPHLTNGRYSRMGVSVACNAAGDCFGSVVFWG